MPDATHPPWCDRDHVVGFDSHAREIGEVELADGGVTIGVSLYQDGDEPVQVWLTFQNHQSTEVSALSSDAARALGGHLVHGADLADGI